MKSLTKALVLGTALAAIGTGAAAQSSADYSFKYTYPAQAAAIPALKAWLEADKARVRTSVARDAAAARREARKNGFPFHAYEAQTEWKVVTDTPRFLSLSANRYSYSGGAHGTPASGALVWDKATKQRLDPKALFISLPAAQAALGPAFCTQLKAAQIKRVGQPTDPKGPFAACPTLKELTLLVGSSNGQRINRIGLIADPYVAGSFAEGAYEITLPVTAAVIAAVKPAHRSAFTTR